MRLASLPLMHSMSLSEIIIHGPVLSPNYILVQGKLELQHLPLLMFETLGGSLVSSRLRLNSHMNDAEWKKRTDRSEGAPILG